MKDQDKVDQIHQMLQQGLSREETAQNLGYKNHRSLEMFMRRRGLLWDRQQHAYVPEEERLPEEPPEETMTRAGQVLRLLATEAEPDLPSIAQRLRFRDAHEMASYLRHQGFVWNPDEKTYVKDEGQFLERPPPEEQEAQRERMSGIPPGISPDFLTFLQDHEQEIRQLLGQRMSKELPMYGLPGEASTKTFQLVRSLQRLLHDFCTEHNVTQRLVVEGAILEYLQRHGYATTVERVLQESSR
ncbi:hypothetical protein [Alkalicoccus urumqiensis]|uniref:Uncharacterized protein n=1 Tax=Alkalicoccus urumqiensis TaxID=1548213 RepID=A0A2P6MHT0_ALKUR|nr:hypothetical protein [Alkalicoccus urumqiensis]PRO65813.1 hypothetical protein C6I21_07905 [Alkalicoccus urumqiensis]